VAQPATGYGWPVLYLGKVQPGVAGEGEGAMAAEDRNGEVGSTQGECIDCSTEEHSFDELARGLADGTLSRHSALRLMGAALVGGMLASVPGVAWAARPAPCTSGRKCGKRCCPDASFVCSRGKCACPAGTELCGGRCVTSCTGGEVLDPTTCQCGPTICPEVSCCCVCNYQNTVTGDYVYVCNTTHTTITLEQCYQSCQTASPPPGTILLPNHGYACESGSSGRQRVCLPEPPGGNSTGTFCSVVQCATSPI
jgi:hypothetical protein